MQANVVKAYMDAWEKAAVQFENTQLSGTTEVAFLLRRAAKIAAKSFGMDAGPIPEMPKVEPAVVETRADDDGPMAA